MKNQHFILKLKKWKNYGNFFEKFGKFQKFAENSGNSGNLLKYAGTWGKNFVVHSKVLSK